MSEIHIPSVMKKMDGFFGYKVLQQKNTDGSIQFSFRKKDFADWIFSIVFGLEKKEQPRAIAISAFKQIAKQIDGADDGEFKSLIEKYERNNTPIDYNKIKKILQTSLAYHPPRVYSRHSSATFNNSSIGSNEIKLDFMKMYLQNIRKSVCRGDKTVRIFREGPFGSVTDENLEALAEAMFLHYREGKEEVEIIESSYPIGTRMELMQYEILKTHGAVFFGQMALRIEILKFRAELMRTENGISVKEIKRKTKEAFKAKKDQLKETQSSLNQ